MAIDSLIYTLRIYYTYSNVCAYVHALHNAGKSSTFIIVFIYVVMDYATSQWHQHARKYIDQVGINV